MGVADQIIVHGHTKGKLMNSDGAVCLTGAALLAAGYDLEWRANEDVAYLWAYNSLEMAPYADAFREVMDMPSNVTQEVVWEKVFRHNDGEYVSEADALRLAKIVDEVMDRDNG